ncbi:MAG TPA: hypothetical protein VFY89_00580 [Ktedonobacterales bacterium]
MVETYSEKMQPHIKAMRDGRADATRQLCDFVQGEMEELKRLLAPIREDFDARIDRPTSLTHAEISWATLRDAILDAAELAWNELLDCAKDRHPGGHDQQDAWKASLELRAAACRRLLRLWMEAGLYRLRLLSNFDYLSISHRKDESERVNRKCIRQLDGIISAYRQRMREWDRAIYKKVRMPLLAVWFEDAEHIELLSVTFGPSRELAAREDGWAQVASQAKAHLSFLSQEIRRKAYRHEGHVGGYLGLSALLLVTRHGTRKQRLLIVPIIVLVSSFVAYFGDDHWIPNACGVSHGLSLGGYASYTITALTGLGQIGPAPCGPHLQLITTTESVLGYLSLALLASLLFEFLTRDRIR